MAEAKELNEAAGLLGEIEEGLNHFLGGLKGTLWLKPILERHGGQELYVPKSTELYKAARDKAIFNAYNGKNGADLAAEWGVTEKTVRNIYNQERKKRQSI